MSASTKAELETLHGAIARKLTDSIDNMESGDKGLAALLNVARQFVKDNHVEAVPAKDSDLGKLNNKLQEYPFDPQADTAGPH